MPVKEAAADALIDMKNRGKMTLETAQSIYSEAVLLSGADQDNAGTRRTLALYDKDKAVKLASKNYDSLIQSGGTENPSSSDSSVVRAPEKDTQADLYYKTRSKNQGKFCVLVPEQYAKKVASVSLKDSTGKVVDSGKSYGYGDAGVREKFVFSMSGSHYGNNITIELKLTNGQKVRFAIADPNKSTV